MFVCTRILPHPYISELDMFTMIVCVDVLIKQYSYYSPLTEVDNKR